MLKIAIASERDLVAEHFGHCQNFNVYDVDNDKIIKQTSIPNPGHRPGYLPLYLKNLGVNVIISGGMGQSAVKLFNENNIEVIVVSVGNVFDIVNDYINGKLKSTGFVCYQHKLKDDC